MECPCCTDGKTRVLETRERTRRWRVCTACGVRFATREVVIRASVRAGEVPPRMRQETKCHDQ